MAPKQRQKGESHTSDSSSKGIQNDDDATSEKVACTIETVSKLRNGKVRKILEFPLTLRKCASKKRDAIETEVLNMQKHHTLSHKKERPKKKKKYTYETDGSRRCSERIAQKNFKLPFSSLPAVCMILVFSFLTPQERGICLLVCQEWKDLITLPVVWSRLNFACLNPMPLSKKKRQDCAKLYKQYLEYKSRICSYVTFLKLVRPKLECLSFSFDIGQSRDEWFMNMSDVLKHSNMHVLKHVDMNWQNTPVRPPGCDTFCCDEFRCVVKKTRVMVELHYRRVKKFHTMLGKISTEAPNLNSISMPFDWSERSVLLLCRFKYLRSLKLHQYLMLHGVQQDLIDLVLKQLVYLKYFELEICVQRFSSEHLFTISHPHLEELSLEGCKGVFLRKVNLPCLTHLTVTRSPWKGPLVEGRRHLVPCLYQVLKLGAPKLLYLNNLPLYPYWLGHAYEELTTELRACCPCTEHWVLENTGN